MTESCFIPGGQFEQEFLGQTEIISEIYTSPSTWKLECERFPFHILCHITQTPKGDKIDVTVSMLKSVVGTDTIYYKSYECPKDKLLIICEMMCKNFLEKFCDGIKQWMT